MTNVLLIAGGCAVVSGVVVDTLWTVLWSGRGAGPLTNGLTGLVRRGVAFVARGRREILSITGPLALVAVAFAWAGLLLVGFSLVVQAMPDGVREAATGRSADAMERTYYAGYTLFTLGNGDFVPHGDGARALTVLMNALGMFLLTLSVTYVLPVVSASVKSRSFASSALALGGTPHDVLVNAWDGRRIRLDQQLQDLAAELTTLAHQHLAYPVLHLFHSSDERSSAPLAVALVDETLELLDGVDPDVAPPAPARLQLRSAIDRYLETFGPHTTEAERPRPSPSLEPVAAAGIPLDADGPRAERTEADRRRHRRLQRILENDGVSAPGEEQAGG